MKKIIFVKKIKKFIIVLFFAIVSLYPRGHCANGYFGGWRGGRGPYTRWGGYNKNFYPIGYGSRFGGGYGNYCFGYGAPFAWNIGVPYDYYGPFYGSFWGPIYGPVGYPTGLSFAMTKQYESTHQCECPDCKDDLEENIKAKYHHKHYYPINDENDDDEEKE